MQSQNSSERSRPLRRLNNDSQEIVNPVQVNADGVAKRGRGRPTNASLGIVSSVQKRPTTAARGRGRGRPTNESRGIVSSIRRIADGVAKRGRGRPTNASRGVVSLAQRAFYLVDRSSAAEASSSSQEPLAVRSLRMDLVQTAVTGRASRNSVRARAITPAVNGTRNVPQMTPRRLVHDSIRESPERMTPARTTLPRTTRSRSPQAETMLQVISRSTGADILRKVMSDQEKAREIQLEFTRQARRDQHVAASENADQPSTSQQDDVPMEMIEFVIEGEVYTIPRGFYIFDSSDDIFGIADAGSAAEAPVSIGSADEIVAENAGQSSSEQTARFDYQASRDVSHEIQEEEVNHEEVPEDDQEEESEVPEDDQEEESEVPEDDQEEESEVPEDDQEEESEVPEDDQEEETEVPEDDQEEESEVPEDDQEEESEVPEDDQEEESEVPEDDQEEENLDEDSFWRQILRLAINLEEIDSHVVMTDITNFLIFNGISEQPLPSGFLTPEEFNKAVEARNRMDRQFAEIFELNREVFNLLLAACLLHCDEDFCRDVFRHHRNTAFVRETMRLDAPTFVIEMFHERFLKEIDDEVQAGNAALNKTLNLKSFIIKTSVGEFQIAEGSGHGGLPYGFATVKDLNASIWKRMKIDAEFCEDFFEDPLRFRRKANGNFSTEDWVLMKNLLVNNRTRSDFVRATLSVKHSTWKIEQFFKMESEKSGFNE